MLVRPSFHVSFSFLESHSCCGSRFCVAVSSLLKPSSEGFRMFYSPHIETCESSHSGAARQTSFEAEMASSARYTAFLACRKVLWTRIIRRSSPLANAPQKNHLPGYRPDPHYTSDRRTDRSGEYIALNNANIRHERLIAVEISHQPGVDECWGYHAGPSAVSYLIAWAQIRYVARAYTHLYLRG